MGIRYAVRFPKEDKGGASEVNPESWTQLKGSNEKGI